MSDDKDLRVALAHDYLKQFGGAERVVVNLHEIWPEAPLYTLFTDLNDEKIGPFKEEFENLEIHNTFFNKFPFKPLVSPLRFLIPMAWEGFDFSDYDVVLSSAGWGMAYSVLTKPKTMHVCYCHTPPRNLYGMASRMVYYKRNRLKGVFATTYSGVVNPFMRKMDYIMAQRPDYFIANSENVKKRIQKFYNRDAAVIYPPVRIPRMRNPKSEYRNPKGEDYFREDSRRLSSNARFPKRQQSDRGSYFLIVNRLEPEKMTDLSVQACKELGLKLKIVGTGTDLPKLKKLAEGAEIEFLGKVSDQKLDELYRGCSAFLLNEKDVDFGIVAVEAQAYGKPVFTIRSGGYLETVKEGKTGEFYDKPTLESVVKGLKNFNPKKYNPKDCIKNAKRFSEERFKK